MSTRHNSRMRRALAGAILGLIAILALGATAAWGSSLVVHAVHSRANLRAYWNPARMRHAEPLSVRVVGSGPIGRNADATPAVVSPTAKGTDTGDPTVYPNSANGVLYGSYGSQDYSCSGSVVTTSAGDAVLTSGHCVIDPGPGTQATNLLFVPGFRDPSEPYGEWPATSFATTALWQSTANTGNDQDADEAGDMAIVTLANRASDGASVQSVVGSVGMGFNQPRQQTYTEYGYPAEFPYDGTKLYKLTAPWSTDDSSFSPATMGIVSDFTPGASGGPWLVGSPPVALSISDYRYVFDNHMYGPYFGSLAQQLYASVGGTPVGANRSSPSNFFVVKHLTRIRRRGRAILQVKVPGPGMLELRGNGLRAVTRTPSMPRIVRLPVRPKGATLQKLHGSGAVHVEAKIAYTPTGGETRVKIRDLTLTLLGHG